MGTAAPGGNTCANPGCTDKAKGKKSRTCGQASCRKQLQRLRDARIQEWIDEGVFESQMIMRCGDLWFDYLEEVAAGRKVLCKWHEQFKPV